MIKDLGYERVQHCHYRIAPIIMSFECKVHKDFVIPFCSSVYIKAVEDIFRSIGDSSSPVNMKYTRSITTKLVRVRFVQADPTEPMLRTM